MSPPEAIALPKGVLSRVREADAEQMAEAVSANLEHLRPWMPWAPDSAARQVEAQRAWHREVEGQWEGGSDYTYTLREDPGGPVIGTFGLHRRIGPRAVEIGYWVHVDFVGRGYATSGAAALTQVALGLSGIARVEIHTDEANTVSAAIPRRLGYRLDRVDVRPPEAPAESGRLQIWVTGPEAAG
jgi:RimJ/RimL family protein N-acetyltransferase